jgi:hypothetical protein
MKWEVNFVYQALNLWQILNWRLGGLYRRSGMDPFKKKQSWIPDCSWTIGLYFLSLPGTEPRYVGRPAGSTVTIVTVLSRLLLVTVCYFKIFEVYCVNLVPSLDCGRFADHGWNTAILHSCLSWTQNSQKAMKMICRSIVRQDVNVNYNNIIWQRAGKMSWEQAKCVSGTV